jgi:hypothetical protein
LPAGVGMPTPAAACPDTGAHAVRAAPYVVLPLPGFHGLPLP